MECFGGSHCVLGGGGKLGGEMPVVRKGYGKEGMEEVRVLAVISNLQPSEGRIGSIPCPRERCSVCGRSVMACPCLWRKQSAVGICTKAQYPLHGCYIYHALLEKSASSPRSRCWCWGKGHAVRGSAERKPPEPRTREWWIAHRSYKRHRKTGIYGIEAWFRRISLCGACSWSIRDGIWCGL